MSSLLVGAGGEAPISGKRCRGGESVVSAVDSDVRLDDGHGQCGHSVYSMFPEYSQECRIKEPC